MKNNKTVEHADLDDLIEHARSVHLTIVTACVALLSLIAFRQPEDYAQAIMELKQIRDGLSPQTWNYANLTSDFKNAFNDADNTHDTADVTATCTLPDGDHSFGLSNRAAFRTIDAPRGGPWPLGGRLIVSPHLLAAIEDRLKPKTLTDFRTDWDRLQSYPAVKPDLDHLSQTAEIEEIKLSTVGVPVAPENTVAVPVQGSKATVNCNYSRQSSGIPVLFAQAPISATDDQNTFFYKTDLQAAGRTLRITIPVKAKNIEINLLTALSHRLGLGSTLSFSRTFASLDSATAEKQDAEFSVISVRLDDAEARAKAEPFELLGIKVPTSAAAKWGILVVLVLQFYLWVQLHEVRPVAADSRKQTAIAWIGIYESWPARITFWISIALLPAGTVFLMTLQLPGGWHGWHIVWYGSFVILSIAFSSLIIRRSAQISQS
jgi:hypothetical protein